MTDRAFSLTLDRLRSIAARKQRFSYDVRGNSYVTRDLVVAYRVAGLKEEGPDLESVLRHAIEHDAIVSGVRDPEDGRMHFSSCRLFTDTVNATAFAKANGQDTIYNWNRWEEVDVESGVRTEA